MDQHIRVSAFRDCLGILAVVAFEEISSPEAIHESSAKPPSGVLVLFHSI